MGIGGQRNRKRGQFVPPVESVVTWDYVNIDPRHDPDFLCDACDLSIVSGTSYDFVVLAEVLEHLSEPALALSEAYRVLKKGGRIKITVLFLYPIHGDPDDYIRWTPSKLRTVLEAEQFTDIEIKSMRGMFAVIYDLLYVASTWGSRCRGSFSLRNRIAQLVLKRLIRPVFFKLDMMYAHTLTVITTGFYVTATRGK